MHKNKLKSPQKNNIILTMHAKNWNRGEVPERSKGTDCKSVGSAFEGSNPSLTTSLRLRGNNIEVLSRLRLATPVSLRNWQKTVRRSLIRLQRFTLKRRRTGCNEEIEIKAGPAFFKEYYLIALRSGLIHIIKKCLGLPFGFRDFKKNLKYLLSIVD